jgi:hypothetical protein
MEIIRIDKPENYRYAGEDQELDEYDLKAIPKEVILIKYWYAKETYEGSGIMILQTADGYYLHDMSHCSCFGPTEHLELTRCYKSIEEMIENCSEELQGMLPIKGETE